MRICIFCSANERIDPDFFSMTRELGVLLARDGHEIVFGGCAMGLMEALAESAYAAGGKVVGVVPRIVEDGGGQTPYLTEVVPCRDLTERKALMLERSDVFLVLPGGLGTLDELFTIAASATIGYHSKKIVVWNMKGFWTELVSLLDALQQKGMIRGTWQRYIIVAERMEEVMRELKEAREE